MRIYSLSADSLTYRQDYATGISRLYADHQRGQAHQPGIQGLGYGEDLYRLRLPGEPYTSQEGHTVGADTRTEVYVHTYDQGERLLKTTVSWIMPRQCPW